MRCLVEKANQRRFYDKGWSETTDCYTPGEKPVYDKTSRLVKEGGAILDVGCGTGFLLSLLKEEKLYALDVSKVALLQASKIRKAELLLGDGNRLPFKEEVFDTVICIEVLEHVEEPTEVINESFRVLRRGGKAIFSVPNSAGVYRQTGEHLNSFTLRAFRSLVRTKFVIQETFTIGLWLPLVTRLLRKGPFNVHAPITLCTSFIVLARKQSSLEDKLLTRARARVVN